MFRVLGMYNFGEGKEGSISFMFVLQENLSKPIDICGFYSSISAQSLVFRLSTPVAFCIVEFTSRQASFISKATFYSSKITHLIPYTLHSDHFEKNTC
jgi:hypothetical protein